MREAAAKELATDTAPRSTPETTEPSKDTRVVDPAAPTPAALPEIKISARKPQPKRAPAANPAAMPQATAAAVTTAPAPGAPDATQAALARKMQALDQSREQLLPKLGASSYAITREAIDTLPQGENTSIDRVILQAPGVSADSAVSNPNFHVRNEYANVQTRINGVILPEGVSGLGPVLDTNFVGSLALLTGTLPAQYGLRTAGVLDLTSRSFAVPSGSVSLYGGSRGTVTPSFDYGGSAGNTAYFVTARGNWNSLGIENPTAGLNALHDRTEQGKFFGFASTLIDPSTRLSLISGASSSRFQIPNNPNQTPLGDFGPTAYSSTNLDEHQYDRFFYNIAALQTKGERTDTQFAVFARYANVHFVPDVFGDLVFNDVASDVVRESYLYGTQFDAAYAINDLHRLRTGFTVSAEKTNVTDVSTVLPGAIGNVTSTVPQTVTDATSLVGWNIGTYVQDEWTLSSTLTLNFGLRFDQLHQFVDANQFSPRAALVWKPLAATTVHAGYARYFTPPMQAQATPTNLALFANTTNQPAVPTNDPVRPERSHYFDVGIDHRVMPGLDLGFDAYYKMATDMIDDGQFGQAVVLTQFNWARGYSEGLEFKVKYQTGDFKAYANFAYGISKAIDAVSNQYLLDADEYAYLKHNYHYTDDMQRMTGSAGASYRRDKTLVSADLIYGSGQRSGFANIDHTTPYASVNLGIAREFQFSPGDKPITARFDIVNLFDQIYALRDGTGIGVFAPQFGPRRGFYFGLSQKL